MRPLHRPLGAPPSIVVSQPIRMVDLTKLGLQRVGIRPSEMFETNTDDYPRTRALAQWLHEGCQTRKA